MFQDCHECEYTIDATFTKLFIQSCTKCKFIIKDKIVSATMDVYCASDLDCVFESPVLTLQVDQCNHTRFAFPNPEHFKMVIWAGCEKLSVRAGDKELHTGMTEMSKEFQNLRADIDQFKIHMRFGEIINERVMRLDNGYPTTHREAGEFDKRQEANIQKLAESLGITIHNKKATGPKVGKNEPCPCGSGKKYKNCCCP